MKKLIVYVNNDVVYEYDRNIAVDEQQLTFLDKMDADMDKGIKIQGELLSGPDSKHRAKFISLNLIKGLQQDNHAVILSSCAYLVNRYPMLTEVHANDSESNIDIELVEEELN